MNSSSQPASSADYYFGVLRNLNADSKLDLISELSQSLKQGDKNYVTTLQSLFGAYTNDETAEEIIESIRSAGTL